MHYFQFLVARGGGREEGRKEKREGGQKVGLSREEKKKRRKEEKNSNKRNFQNIHAIKYFRKRKILSSCRARERKIRDENLETVSNYFVIAKRNFSKIKPQKGRKPSPPLLPLFLSLSLFFPSSRTVTSFQQQGKNFQTRAFNPRIQAQDQFLDFSIPIQF